MFSEEVLAIMPECVAWRRHMHADPELSFNEYRTTAYIDEALRGIPGVVISKPTKTGLIADINGAEPGRAIAVRCDIDALPMTEETGLPFASKNPSAMHSCGHDGHTAAAMAAVRLIAARRSELRGSVRFIFQHAEELPPGGAAEMEAAGVVRGIEEIYGLHLSSSFTTGTFGIRKGALTSATDRFDITVVGKGGHSAFPETCRDPIVAAAQIILALQTVVSRRIKAVEPAVLSVCMINAGSAYNIIPGEVAITGSTRTFDAATRAALPGMIEDIVKGICLATGIDYRFKFVLGYASVINDARLTEIGRRITEETFGRDAAFELDPLMPGEDFSAFTKNVPGFFIEIGARSEEKGAVVPHHNSKYIMDEDALTYCVEYLYRLVLDRLGGR